MFKQNDFQYTLFLVLSDIISVVIALLLATMLRFAIPLGYSGFYHVWALPMPVYFIGIAIFAFITTLLNVYHPDATVLLGREMQRLAASSILGWFIFLGTLYLLYREISRLQMLYFLAIYITLIWSTRVVLRLFRAHKRFHVRRVVVIGSDAIARQVIDGVQQYRWGSIEFVGTIVEDDAHRDGAVAPVLGTLPDTQRLVEAMQIDEVILTVKRDPDFDLRQFIHGLQTLPISIRMVPDYFDLVYLQTSVEDFGGLPLLALKKPVLTEYQRLVKRVFDVTITLMLMPVAIPVMAIVSLLIYLDSGGPIFFRQERLGEQGKIFEMLKFRTMIPNAETLQHQVSTVDEQGNVIYKRKDDPRVTRIGHLLRSTSLDELPQLLNILRGDMSLVGPRPEMPSLVEKYEPWQRKRFEVPQGLTGWWQINGRSNKPMYLHTEEDMFYIRNYSLALDLLILWRTIGVVFSRRGAY